MFEFIFSAPHGTLERFEEKRRGFSIISRYGWLYIHICAINDIHAGVLQIIEKYLSYIDYFTDIRKGTVY